MHVCPQVSLRLRCFQVARSLYSTAPGSAFLPLVHRWVGVGQVMQAVVVVVVAAVVVMAVVMVMEVMGGRGSSRSWSRWSYSGTFFFWKRMSFK